MRYRGMLCAAVCALALTGAPSRAATVVDGYVKVVLAVTLKSTLPANSAVYCQVHLDAFDESGSYALADKVIQATGSGSSYSCTVDTPYRWNFGSSTGEIGGQYSAFIGSLQDLTEWDSSSVSITAFPLPAAGTITPISGGLWL